MNSKLKGKYYSQILDEKSGMYNEYIFEIQGDKKPLKFSLDMSTVSGKGTMGIRWEGNLIDRGDHFAIIIRKEIDWVKTPLRKIVSHQKEKNDSAKIEIYPDEEKILIYHKSFPKLLVLHKIE